MAYINVDINETEIFINYLALNPIEEELQNFIIKNN